ncbi:MAG: hypothetical protein JST16_02990 [Bdellovibrionales bacterium]|nr:hypothetical protein [Bdellovibrionales bacterium]
MAVHFFSSSPFEEARGRIEQHLFDSIMEIENDSSLALASVNRLAQAIDRIADTLEQMYQTPKAHDTVGEKSALTSDGRYRVFYKVAVRENLDFEVTFLDVDDNRQSNIDRFPSHKMPSFDD